MLEAAIDAEGVQGVGHLHRHALFRTQALQRGDHRAGAGQVGAGGVGAELAAAREPHDDDAGEDAEHQFGEDGRDEVADARAVLVLQDGLVDEVAEDPREEHHEGVHHALDQCQGDHVAVGDVTDLVGEDGFHLIGRETFEQALADRDQRVVLVPAGGEGVGLVGGEDADLRHLDAGFAGQLFDGLQQPLFVTGARLADDFGTGAHLRHPLGDEQRDQRTGETEHGAEDQQAAVILAGEAVHPEQFQGDAGNHQDCQVGGQEQQDAHHGVKLLLTAEGTERGSQAAGAGERAPDNHAGLYKGRSMAIQSRDYFKLCRLARPGCPRTAGGSARPGVRRRPAPAPGATGWPGWPVRGARWPAPRPAPPRPGGRYG